MWEMAGGLQSGGRLRDYYGACLYDVKEGSGHGCRIIEDARVIRGEKVSGRNCDERI